MTVTEESLTVERECPKQVEQKLIMGEDPSFASPRKERN
jgi:hypothetical protein